MVKVEETIQGQVGEVDESHIEDGASGKNSLSTSHKEPGCRRAERLESCRNTLTSWRTRTWVANFKLCAWGPEALMADTVLTKLASRARLKTIVDVEREIPEWSWVGRYGEEVLALLATIDAAWHEEKEQEKAEKKAKRKRISAEEKEKRDALRLVQRRQATAQRKAGAMASSARPVLYPMPVHHIPHPAAVALPLSLSAQPQLHPTLPRYPYPVAAAPHSESMFHSNCYPLQFTPYPVYTPDNQLTQNAMPALYPYLPCDYATPAQIPDSRMNHDGPT